MKAVRVVRAMVATLVVAAGLVVLAPVAAQAMPKGCAGLASRMRSDIDLGHAARLQGDYVVWQVYQDDYVDAWYEYQDLGCR